MRKWPLALALMAVSPVVVSSVAEAAPKAKAVNQKRAPKAKAKKAPKEEAPPADTKAESAGPALDAAAAAPAEPATKESGVQSAGTKATAQKSPKGAVKEEEGPEGVKTYEFSAIEVEGRLRSPQILYFLRRVRAEFDAGALGHRSFLGELRDTRNNTAFR
jgi:flagellar motor protein MotB